MHIHTRTLTDKIEDSRTFCHNGSVISYVLTRKNVKNINLRVRLDGTVAVSAPKSVPLEKIESFIQSKAAFILKAQHEFAKTSGSTNEKLVFIHSERILEEVLVEAFKDFNSYNLQMLTLKIRTMKTRWGSCTPSHNSITLNRKLLAYPKETIKYVATHELCHMVHPNHSKEFYDLLIQIMPDWEIYRNQLRK